MIFIENNSLDPFYNHALEEYILTNTKDEVFILWRNRKSILIGRNQNTGTEIDTGFADRNGIDVVRRLSGGGTVFCDEGNINFTFITNKKGGNAGFEKFAKPVVKALNHLGIPAEFSGRNDITIEGQKVSGNAQYHYKNRLLHHGTILYSGDLSLLAGALKPNPLKFKDKGVRSVASRVTNISRYQKDPMDVVEFKTFLQNFIMKENQIEEIRVLNESENQQVESIMNERFLDWEWNYGNNPKYAYKHCEKYPFGLIEFHLDVEKGMIKDLSVKGDFFGKEPIENLEIRLIGIKHDKKEMTQALKDIDIDDYIAGMKKREFIKGFFENRKKPDWLKVKFQSTSEMKDVKNMISDLSLNTICLEANCPNRMECYNRKTATFMILGRNCTRNCTFCNVTKTEPDPVDHDETRRIGEAVKKLGLRHAVITSVTRDDLPDQGAEQFAEVVRSIRKVSPETRIELLIPDMQGQEDLIDIVLNEEPDFLNHNIETVPRLYDRVRPMASYQRSLDVIKYTKKVKPDLKTKSGMMLGLGETKEEVIETMQDLFNHGCDILTLGQYLQPSKEHLEIEEYITPEQFEEYKKLALEMGFKSVASAPLVRSSYHADELDF